MASRESDIWRPFVVAAVVLALVPGFGLGGLLVAAPLLGLPLGAWWPAAAQVHGHTQLFGWAGLMVLGIAFHFLPRLRGRPLAHPAWARWVLWLIAGGLVLRSVAQPLLALSDTLAWRAALALSGVMELAGFTVALAMLARTLRGPPPLASRAAFAQVVPFLATALVCAWLALVANLVGVVVAASAPWPAVRVPGWASTVHNLFGTYGFLVPISVGMGVRLFPLHLGAHQPGLAVLRAGLALLLVGLALRLAGEVGGIGGARALGLAAVAAAVALFVAGSRVFAARRLIVGRRPWYTEPAQWLGLSAFAWLAVAGLLLAWAAFATVVPSAGPVALGAEWHILGAGFVTMLILGEGVNLLPGFARRPLRREWPVWAMLVVGNLAALLRVGPALVPGVFGGWALGLSGAAGLLAVALFASIVAGLVRGGDPPPAARLQP